MRGRDSTHIVEFSNARDETFAVAVSLIFESTAHTIGEFARSFSKLSSIHRELIPVRL